MGLYYAFHRQDESVALEFRKHGELLDMFTEEPLVQLETVHDFYVTRRPGRLAGHPTLLSGVALSTARRRARRWVPGLWMERLTLAAKRSCQVDRRGGGQRVDDLERKALPDAD